jgi:regulatory protein
VKFPVKSKASTRGPREKAMVLLTRREHSRKELVAKLTARGVDAAQASAVVDELATAGWQDDIRFAELLVRSRVNGGYGPVRIRAELATHGLGDEEVAAALSAFDGDWGEVAQAIARRRFGPELPRDLALRRKAADFLLRRGFASEHVRAAVRPHGDGQV